MQNVILVSFLGEGNTDYRFFSNIVQWLISELLLEKGKEGLIQWQPVNKNGISTQEIIYNASVQAKTSSTLVLHSDTENKTVEETIETKFKSGLEQISKSGDGEVCKNITLVIPITETEAWMLVDKELLKTEMNTNLSSNDLGLTYQQNRIESISDPKQKINNAINIHHQRLPKKRRKYAVLIEDLYESISQNIELSKLECLSSYKKFKSDLTSALQRNGHL